MPRTCRFVGQAKQDGYSPSLRIPPPRLFPNLLLPAIQSAAEGEPDFWVEGYCRKKEWAPWIQLRGKLN